MRSARTKARFHAGQVVCSTSDGSYGKLIYPHEARPTRLPKRLFSKEGNVYVLGAKKAWYHRSELRSLTAEERRV